jgi:hypothetical protein
MYASNSQRFRVALVDRNPKRAVIFDLTGAHYNL